MHIPPCDDLTTDQKMALEGYFNRKPQKRLFYGVIPEECIRDFRKINEIRVSDPGKAERKDAQMFTILRYEKS